MRELKSQYGIDPTPDEIICLHELGKLVENPPGDEARYLRGEPELAGNVWLFPFTIGASMWWRDAVARFSEKDPVTTYLLPLALHYARKPDVLNRLMTSQQIRLAVDRFVRKLGCTVEELDYAIDRVLPKVDSDDSTEKSDVDWEAVIGILCRYFKGTTPDYWTWSTSMDVALSMLSKSAKIMAGEGEEFDDRDPAFRAVHNLQMAFNEIVRSRGLDVK